MAIRKPVPPAAPAGSPFGDLGFYSGSFVLPKGRYSLEFNVLLHAGTRPDGSPAGKPRLGVMVVATPLDGGDAMEQFLSMGSKADLSFAPSPNGKGIVPIPGGPASTAPRNTNWNLFLKSLYDSGMPQGVFTDDISVLDGIHVQTDLVPEPEERKGYASTTTGEASQQEERRGSGMIPVVTEVLESGMPWANAAPGKAAPKAPAKPTKSAPAAPAAPAAPEAEESSDEVQDAALSAVTTILEAEPAGTTKLKLRMGVFKAVNAAGGDQLAQSVINTYFSSDDALNGLLGELGYQVAGTAVKPQ